MRNNMDNKNFSEYFWEEELRKEDAKMHFCMHEIPSVIDLPNEYELLFNKVKKKPEFSTNLPTLFEEDEVFDDFIENDLYVLPDEWKNSKWYNIYIDIEGLLDSWRIFSTESDLEVSDIQVLAFYAMLSRMTINLINLAEDGQFELQKAVSKRIIGIINKILLILQNPNLQDLRVVKYHFSKLLVLRDKVINIRFSLNK
jgi:hypothetical protein